MAENAVNSAPEAEAADASAAAAETFTEAGKEGLETFDLAVPEAFRSAAEQVVTQSREAYERTKDAMEETVEMLELSLDKTGQGAAEINRKVIELAQTNLNSGFDLAKELSGAKNVAEFVEVQTAFARKQFEAFTAQMEEFRALSTKVAGEASEPMKAHVAQSIETLKVH